ncbi:OmpA family protein [Luteimonas sp. S4-F44]|uniref:OmpA family protein n=1 Tax=Luteimonas sp. S4-F44 TaxID=2925842 RepID=UPI001F537C58|nr:OmpA family protein [Luteimonas sp. S4-F44]UNK42519.1 OmpA family protein [Luteimonas sp. S4-F44]
MQIDDQRRPAHAPGLARAGAAAMAIALMLAACTDRDAASSTSAGDQAAAVSELREGPEPPSALDATREAGPEPDAVSGFSLDKLPISTTSLGDFPYFQLPAGYASLDSFARVYPFDRVGFWTGDRVEWVEGKFHVSHIRADGVTYSPIQVERNIAAIVEQAGGVQVFSGREPPEAAEEIRAGTSSFAARYRNGLCFHTEPVHVYVIRRTDRAIWIRQCSNGDKGGGWIIGETEPFEATAALLPSSQIEQALGESGRIALQVNFASDEAVVLDESMPQIGEIVSLLKANDGLRLSIEGHTDDTGTPERNRVLALARAQAVVDLVVARGIDASRLEAAGYGSDRPVADNTSEDGKATNRRVELVSLQ